MVMELEARVESNVRLSADYNVVTLEAPGIAANANPGQFVMVKLSDSQEPLLRRPFSIFEISRNSAGAPTGFSLLNKRIGLVTQQIFDLTDAKQVSILGPLGRPFTVINKPTQAWLVAGGVGLAPFVMLSEKLRRQGVAVTLFYGARSATELLCMNIFEQLGVSVVTATEDGSLGMQGVITVALNERLQKIGTDEPLMIYACGPTLMMQAVTNLATEYHLPIEVSLEQVMGCGLGGCYSCVVRIRDEQGQEHYTRSCLNGPVLPGERIVWEAL